MKLFAALSAFSVTVQACGGIVNEYQSYIYSTANWYHYPNNMDCTWNIELGNVFGFTIVNTLFDVEFATDCGFDYLKIVANGFEQNFCGETYAEWDYGSDSYHGDYSYGIFGDDSSSSSSSSSDRKRRSSSDKKEDGKSTADLVNVSNDGFPDRMFISGGSATIRFITDSSVRHMGFNFRIEKPSRFDIIQYHVGRVVDSDAGQYWARYGGRMNKVLNRLQAADTGVSCYDENFPEEAADEEDEVTVFDSSNMCKLNKQVNAAINSYARNYACEGRGKVYRQIIRSARKIERFFYVKHNCYVYGL